MTVEEQLEEIRLQIQELIILNQALEKTMQSIMTLIVDEVL